MVLVRVRDNFPQLPGTERVPYRIERLAANSDFAERVPKNQSVSPGVIDGSEIRIQGESFAIGA